MPLLLRRRGKYEVVVESKGRPSIDGIFDDEAMAIERAQYLLRQAKYTLVEVYRVSDSGREEPVFSKAYGGGGKITTISQIDDANVCADVLAVFSYESRMTLLRLLRTYFDDQQVIPAEQLHRYYPLRYLERDAVLFNPAMSRLATLQAPKLGVAMFARLDQLTRMFGQLKEMAQAGTALAVTDKALVSGGVAGLLTAAGDRPVAERDRIVTHAFAAALEEAREWGAKVETILRYRVDGDADAIRVCDELLAETVDGREPIRALIGYAPDTGTALLSLLAVADGRLDDRLPNTPALLALSDAMAAGGLVNVGAAVMRRVAGALDAANPLTRAGGADEARMFFALVDRLTAADGYRGGAEMAAALVRRGKTVMATGGLDLSFDDTVRRLNLRLPSPAARIGFLLDLAASPFGHRRFSVLIEEVAAIFQAARSVSELAPTGMPGSEVRSRFSQRLAAAGVPKALASALIAKMGGLPDDLGPVTIATLSTAEVRQQRLPAVRLRLVHNGVAHLLEGDDAAILIGRSRECGIVIDSPAGSRQHARIHVADRRFVLTDLSRNGTVIIPENGQPQLLIREASVALDATGLIRIGGDDDSAVRINWTVLTD